MGTFKDLLAYKKSFQMAMEIFILTKEFPKEETYSLIDQIRRSSRSISTCIAEAYRKRRYPNHFLSKLSDSDMECAETETWIDFSFACKYINADEKKYLAEAYTEIGKLIGYMIQNPDKFL